MNLSIQALGLTTRKFTGSLQESGINATEASGYRLGSTSTTGAIVPAKEKVQGRTVGFSLSLMILLEISTGEMNSLV